MEYVFQINGTEYNKLKDVLALDPYSRDSFVLVGYTLKEAKTLGIGEGYILYFKTEDAEIGKKLCERLKPIESAKELSGEEKEKIIAKIKEEEESAAQGFGSIFG